MKHTGIIEWTLTKEMVEKKLGFEINEQEFKRFAELFEENFRLQFNETLDWQAEEWEEVKEW
jgi:hypothetical protein